MNVNERAAQMWPLLVWAAHNRQTLTYRILAQCTGMHLPGLGKCLEPIQSYCLLEKLPPLTSIVVDEEGRPGAGFIAAAGHGLIGAQAQVFKTEWLKLRVPISDDFEIAVRRLPSNGVTAAAASVTT